MCQSISFVTLQRYMNVFHSKVIMMKGFENQHGTERQSSVHRSSASSA